MDMYKIFMLVMIPALAIGWIIYWQWSKKAEEEEKKQPKPISKTKKEVSDWAQKMATFDSPAEQARKRKLELDKKLEEQEKKWADQQKKQEQ